MIHGYRTVALCTAEMQNEDVQEIIFPLHHYLKKKNWKTLIFNSTTDMQQDTEFDHGERCVFGLIPYDKIDAFVVFGRNIKQNSVIQEIVDRAGAYNKTVVILDCDTQFDGAVNLVYEEQGAFNELVTHLVRDHHFTKINFIAGIEGNIVSERRYMVFRDVLNRYGVDFNEATQLGYGCFYDFPTISVVEEFIKNPDGLPEAIVCANDTMALTACDILMRHGIRVPEDVVVTGFDGIAREKYAAPRLSTCARDLDRMAEVIGNKLIESIDAKNETEMHDFPLWFKKSESCGCGCGNSGLERRMITQMCSLTYDNYDFDRQMNRFLTQMNMASGRDEMQMLLEEFTFQDTFICTNAEMDTNQIGYHWFNINPFSREMKVYRFFNEEDYGKFIVPVSELLYDWDMIWRYDKPIVFMAIHNHADCCGYTATLLVDENLPSMLKECEHAVRFAITLNSIVSLHVQQVALRRTNDKLREIQESIIASFADLVESRDDSTGMHVKRTQEYISILVRNAAKREHYKDMLDPKTCELIIKAAPLHDIGKITVSDMILNKPGKLTEEEFTTMQNHCVAGAKIIDGTLTGIEDSDYLEIARNVSTYHHEKWNGAGYPYGLKGEDIPICARLMAIVDVFDALTSKRVYKDAYSIEETFRIMAESKGSHFDPELIDVFFDSTDEIVRCFYSNSRSYI